MLVVVCRKFSFYVMEYCSIQSDFQKYIKHGQLLVG